MKLVVGFVGLLASGKSTAAQHAAKILKCRAYALGDEVRRALKKKKMKVTREALQALGVSERKKFGSGIWAKRLVARITKTSAAAAVVEGFRNAEEVREFRKAFGKTFVLIAVTAPVELRFERAKRRMRESERVTSLAAFKKSEAAEPRGAAGGGIAACIAKADYKIVNAGSARGFRKRIEWLVKRLLRNS